MQGLKKSLQFSCKTLYNGPQGFFQKSSPRILESVFVLYCIINWLLFKEHTELTLCVRLVFLKLKCCM